MSPRPGSLAFDFDGVLCNGLKEYFQTAWRVYSEIWKDSPSIPPTDVAPRFYKLRPVVEVGWEMPVVLRAIVQGFSDAEILSRWPDIRQKIVQTESLTPQAIGQAVDQTRDQWIQEDLAAWLDQHAFYPGVIELLKRLQRETLPFVIITTKESRFVKHLLQRAEISLADSKIFGKDCKRPKPQTLKQLQPVLPGPIWFIEDRIAALQAVQSETALQDVQLFLADWGYNTAMDRDQANQDPTLHCLSLQHLGQDFERWTQSLYNSH